MFLCRLRERLKEPPLPTRHEQVIVTKEVYTSLDSDPLIASMHLVEGLHAHAVISCSRSMDRCKQLPRRIFAGQSLNPWQFLHTRRIGKRERLVDSIKQVLLKTKRVAPKSTRVLTGHDMYIKDATVAWRGACFRCVLSVSSILSQSYMSQRNCFALNRHPNAEEQSHTASKQTNKQTHKRRVGTSRGRSKYNNHLAAAHSRWRRMSE